MSSVFFVERTLKIDDPVGAISVHGVYGAWGVLSLGLFADGAYGDGLERRPGHRARASSTATRSSSSAQIVGTVTCFVFVFASFYAFFKVVDVLVGNRVSAEVELEGLDMPEMGALGYPDFVLTPGPHGALAASAVSPKGATVMLPAGETR